MNTVSLAKARTYQSNGPFVPGQFFKLLDDGSVVYLVISTKNRTGQLANVATGQFRRLPVTVNNIYSITKEEIDKMTGMTAFVLVDYISIVVPEAEPVEVISNVEFRRKASGHLAAYYGGVTWSFSPAAADQISNFIARTRTNN